MSILPVDKPCLPVNRLGRFLADRAGNLGATGTATLSLAVAGPTTAPDARGTLGLPGAFAVELRQGKRPFTLDGSDPRAPGGAVAASAQAWPQSVVLNATTSVRARVQSGTNWSGLAEALFGLDQIFSPELVDSTSLRALVVDWLAALDQHGAAAVVRDAGMS